MTTTKYNSLTYLWLRFQCSTQKISRMVTLTVTVQFSWSSDWWSRGSIYSCTGAPRAAIPRIRLTVNLVPRRLWLPDSVDSVTVDPFTDDTGNLAHVPVVPDSLTVVCTVLIQFIYSSYRYSISMSISSSVGVQHPCYQFGEYMSSRYMFHPLLLAERVIFLPHFSLTVHSYILKQNDPFADTVYNYS